MCPPWLIPTRNLLASYPLLAGVILFMLLVIWGVVLDDFGAFYLFWHENWLAAFLSGVAVSFLFGEVLFVVRLIDGYRALPNTGGTAAAANPETTVPNRQVYFYTWLAFLVLSWIPLFTYVEAPVSKPTEAETTAADAAPSAATTAPSKDEGPGCEDSTVREVKVWSFEWRRLLFVAGTLAFWCAAWWLYANEAADVPDQAERTRRLDRRAYWQRWRVAGLYVAIFLINLLVDEWLARHAKWFVPALSVCILFSVYVELYGYVQTRFGAHWFYPAVLWLPIAVVVLKDEIDSLWDKVDVLPSVGKHAGLVGLVLGILCAVAGKQFANARPFFWPAAIVIMVLGFIIQRPFEFRIQGLDDEYKVAEKERPQLANYSVLRSQNTAGLLNDVEVRDAWFKQRPADRPLVMVCVSGGASKSSLFTAATLFALEQSDDAFGKQVRIISGASGGMVGAAVYLVYLQQVRQWEAENITGDALKKKKKELSDQLLEALGEDLLSPMIHRWMFHDMPIFLAWPYTNVDRSQVLEDRLNDEINRVLDKKGAGLDQPFSKLRELERAGKLPSIVFSPMAVEDGRRVLISNLNLEYMTQTALDSGQRDATTDRPLSASAMELFKLFPKAPETFRLGTAARLNSAFPFLSPACVLPTQPRRRLVDAGYYDNYGISVASAWLAEHADWLRTKKVPGVVILQIRAFANECERKAWITDEERLHPQARHQAALQPYTTPLEGMFSARRASMYFRNDEQLRNLGMLLNANRSESFFVNTAVVESTSSAGLSWYLTSNDQDKIIEVPRYLGVVSKTLQSPDNVGRDTKTALNHAADAASKLRQTSRVPTKNAQPDGKAKQ
jgi:hypothetical protein